MAIRPDDMRVTGDGPIAATVEIAEYHGRDFYAVARGADGTELYLPLRAAGGAGRDGAPGGGAGARPGLRRMSRRAPAAAPPRCGERGLDAVTLLVVPGVLFVLALFVYPFLYGLVLSFHPKQRRLRWRIIASSSPIRSSTTRSASRCGSPCPSPC